MSPPTIALAEEPKPRPCGMTFSARIATPFGSPPKNLNPLYIALTSKFLSVRGKTSAPSPEISISNPGSSRICAT